MSGADNLLQIAQLRGGYSEVDIIHGIDLAVAPGEIVTIAGTNGAGKSTLVNMLSGEIAVSSGSIALEGHDVTRMPQPLRAKAGIGRSYQRTTIFPEFTVLENCRLTAQAQAQPRPWRIWESAQHCAASMERAQSALVRAGLAQHAERIAGSLSHGAKRQLEVAMCLATAPRVLLLDEPLAGMGAEETERMLVLLQELKQAHAVLLVEHDMDAVFRIADRITVMVNGSVVATGTPDQSRTDPVVRTAYLGEEEHA